MYQTACTYLRFSFVYAASTVSVNVPLPPVALLFCSPWNSKSPLLCTFHLDYTRLFLSRLWSQHYKLHHHTRSSDLSVFHHLHWLSPAQPDWRTIISQSKGNKSFGWSIDYKKKIHISKITKRESLGGG